MSYWWVTPEWALRRENKRLRRAASALVRKLDEVTAHPDWVGVFGMAHIHGMEYGGPSFNSEHEALRRALELTEGE